MASQTTGNLTDCSVACLDEEEWKNQSSVLLALFEGNPLVTSGFPSQKASNVESISLSWNHHFVEWMMNKWFKLRDKALYFVVCSVQVPF